MRLQPERRQHLRIFTLKNAVWALVGLAVLFMAFSTWNELRPGDPSRERLSDRGGLARPAPKAAPAAVTEEEEVSDQTFSGRDGGYPLSPPPPAPPPPSPAPVVTRERPRPVTLKESRRRGDRIVISGGAEGVSVESTPAPAPNTDTVVPP